MNSVVATPIAVVLWRRQVARRARQLGSAGWTVYLALMEAVFLIAFVVAAFQLLNWLISDGSGPRWTDVVVYGGIVLFHEVAARRTPTTSDSAELPRVVGSAIGFVATAIAVGGILYWALDELYGTLVPTVGGAELGPWLALVLVGAPIWYMRWWRPWPDEPGAPRLAWMFLVSVAGLATAVAAAAFSMSQTLTYLFGSTQSAGQHFDFLPGVLSVGAVAILAWAHHRQRLGPERTTPVQAYEYAMAALGVLGSVGGATWLTSLAFGTSDLVSEGIGSVVGGVTTLLVSGYVWLLFWSKKSKPPREIEVGSVPRRFYLIGLGVVMGLTSAGALISTLVVLFQMAFDSAPADNIAIQASLFVYSGLATWHLLRENARDRELIVSEEVVTPFSVTVVCAHPGMVSTMFPKEATVRVMHRGDDIGMIDDELAVEIVEAVGHRSSYVWVDGDGFRIAPAR